MLASLSSFYDNIRSYSPLASKPGQKRPRNEEDEDVIITDVLQTPPAKRLRNIEETGTEDSNKSTIKTFSKFVSKKIKSWSDKYIWRYVVKGRTPDNSDTAPTRDQYPAEEMEQDRFKRPVNVIPAYQTQSNRRSTDLSRNPLIGGRWPETPSVFTCTSTPARSSVTVSGSGLMSIRGRGTTDQRPYMDKKYDPSKYRDNVDRSLHTTQPRTDRPSFTIGRDSRALPPSFSKSSWRSRAGQNRHTSSRKSAVKQHRIISTAETVIRLNERERYKQLLAQYTSIELPDSRDETWNTTRMPTAHTTPLEVKTDFLTRTQSRTRVVDGSLLSPRSSLLPPPAVPFAAPASPPPPPVVLRVMPSPSKAADQSAHSTTDVSLFSRPGPSEVSVNQTTVPKSSVKPSPEISVYSPFEEGWTKKWRDLLSDESLSRERDISREERKLEALKQKRQEETRTLTDKVKQRRRREELGLEELEDDELEEVDEEEEEEEEGTDAFISLTDEMERRVDAALAPGYPDDPLVEGFRVTIKRSDMATLSNLNWLNDEIINFFFTLIVERSKEKGQPKVHAFNSFFYPKLIKSGYSSLRRWTKKVDIFSMDLVLVPVHLGMHWCLASIDMTKKCISYYDSLKGSNQQCLSSLRAYLNEESLDKKKTPLDLTGWTTATPKDIPEQLNGCDCGVFACKYAEYLSRRSKFDFDQRHMPYFRRRMVFEILNKKLL